MRGEDADVGAVGGGDVGKRGHQAVILQYLWVDTVHRGTQGIQAAVHVLLGRGEELGEVSGGVEKSLPQLHARGHEVLLRAVVQVTLDAGALHLIGIRDGAARGRELRNLLRLLLLMVGGLGLSSEHRPSIVVRPCGRGSAGTTLKSNARAVL